MKSPKRGFTLIELLVVVAIIAVLIAILLPSLSRAKERAKVVKCQLNIKNYYTGMNMYAAEMNGMVLPGLLTIDDHYTGPWYGTYGMGTEFSKSGIVGTNADTSGGNISKGIGTFIERTFRCPDTDPSIAETFRDSGASGPSTSAFAYGIPSNDPSATVTNPINNVGESPTDLDHGTYTYNYNFGNYPFNAAGKYAQKMANIPRNTLAMMESHGGVYKGQYDWRFTSLSLLAVGSPANPQVAKGDYGFGPVWGIPHNNNTNSNMLFIDGRIITDDPRKMLVNGVYTAVAFDWIVQFTPGTNQSGPPNSYAFPYK